MKSIVFKPNSEKQFIFDNVRFTNKLNKLRLRSGQSEVPPHVEKEITHETTFSCKI
jgi:hypothetical protein